MFAAGFLVQDFLELLAQLMLGTTCGVTHGNLEGFGLGHGAYGGRDSEAE
jgi:hypothetical protein